MSSSVFVLLPLLVMLVFAVVIGIIVWAFTRPRKPVQPLAAPPHAGPGAPAAAPAPTPSAWPSGHWNTKVTKVGAFTNLGAKVGVLTLWEGRLGLTLSGAQEPEWVVPCNQVRVTQLSMFTLTGAGVKLEGEFGALNAVVSQEHINMLMENDAKDVRERGYAREFAAMLAASGAQVV